MRQLFPSGSGTDTLKRVEWKCAMREPAVNAGGSGGGGAVVVTGFGALPPHATKARANAISTRA